MAPEPNHRGKRQRVQKNQDDLVNPPTHQGGCPSKKRLADIPKSAIEKAYQKFRRNVFPEDDDNEILDNLSLVWNSVSYALEFDPNLKKHLASVDEFRDNVVKKGEKTFIDSLRAMAANSDTQGGKAWEDLFEDEVFLKEIPAPDVDPLHEARASTSAQEATERAWQRAFKGEAAEVLLLTISSYLDKKRDPYSRQATIVNSSGTGKSRMVDQLATRIITVPMCLRPDPNTGDPFCLSILACS